MHTGDTIVAISSAVGAAARMIVRLSGADARALACAAAPSMRPDSAAIALVDLNLAGLTCPATIYRFAAPRSYTAEDVVEFHVPGNPLLARLVLDELVRRGARHADAGEFTARAYFNGRMNLTEAEGVAATIAAHSQRELRAARQLASGELARRLRPILGLLADSLALVEVGIDFSEEEVSFLSPAALRERIVRIDAELRGLLSDSARFETLAHEPQVVLFGWPNAGKSTLLNALAGEERAVVSAEAGTTRDAIWSHVRLPRGIVRLIDVAGASTASFDRIESSMQERAARAIESADLLVLVRDGTDRRPPPDVGSDADLTVLTKLDLLGQSSQRPSDAVAVSARTGQHLDELRDRLDALAFGERTAAGTGLALNARHVGAITDARTGLQRATDALDTAGPEVIAVELREALDALGRVLGSVTPDDVLGRIFSSFCIGK